MDMVFSRKTSKVAANYERLSLLSNQASTFSRRLTILIAAILELHTVHSEDWRQTATLRRRHEYEYKFRYRHRRQGLRWKPNLPCSLAGGDVLRIPIHDARHDSDESLRWSMVGAPAQWLEQSYCLGSLALIV